MTCPAKYLVKTTTKNTHTQLGESSGTQMAGIGHLCNIFPSVGLVHQFSENKFCSSQGIKITLFFCTYKLYTLQICLRLPQFSLVFLECCFVAIIFLSRRKFLFFLSLIRVFVMNEFWTLPNAFCAYIAMITLLFLF